MDTAFEHPFIVGYILQLLQHWNFFKNIFIFSHAMMEKAINRRRIASNIGVAFLAAIGFFSIVTYKSRERRKAVQEAPDPYLRR